MKKFCEKCNREMQENKFYSYKDGSKFEQCKTCITLHVDNFKPQTYLWILEKADVPYIPQIWTKIRDKAYAKAPKKGLNGTSVIGKYFSEMKLNQWRQFGWADTEKQQQEYNKRVAAKQEENQVYYEQMKQRYENNQISQAQYRTLVSTEFQKQHQYIQSQESENPIGKDNMFNENDFLSDQEMPNLQADLTLEEKQRMVLKWGRTYKVSQWVELEKSYRQMAQAFGIDDPDSKNSLIHICKINLKMNQAIDCGDFEGYQKLSRVYDQLRKSAKFTAVQNKEDKKDTIDSVSALVAFCEEKGGLIPNFEMKAPKDIIDKIIIDLKEYTRTLIYEDTALARQIQDYIKEAKAAAEKKKDREKALASGLQQYQFTDQDILNFKKFIRQQKNKDKKFYNNISKESKEKEEGDKNSDIIGDSLEIN